MKSRRWKPRTGLALVVRRTNVTTPSTVNSCSSNSSTDQFVCVANNSLRCIWYNPEQHAKEWRDRQAKFFRRFLPKLRRGVDSPTNKAMVMVDLATGPSAVSNSWTSAPRLRLRPPPRRGDDF